MVKKSKINPGCGHKSTIPIFLSLKLKSKSKTVKVITY